MTDSIATGSRISVKIVKEPTNAPAAKTLVRLLSKDAKAVAENERHRKIRAKGYAPSRRGGRLYGGQIVKQHPIKATVGASGILTATTDVLRDLGSVARFVEVTAAK
jgi:hypothetical protein